MIIFLRFILEPCFYTQNTSTPRYSYALGLAQGLPTEDKRGTTTTPTVLGLDSVLHKSRDKCERVSGRSPSTMSWSGLWTRPVSVRVSAGTTDSEAWSGFPAGVYSILAQKI